MKNVEKYARGYFMPPFECNDWAKKEYVCCPPKWCSVDLRDGNQALIVPMSLQQKLEFFGFLCDLGFKEIEVGFPAASETEFEFVRELIEGKLIPDDVTIQVLTQSREHIIEKTFEALRGVKRAVVHLYNSTSVSQREQVFRKNKEEIIEIAKFGAQLCKEYAEKTEGEFLFEYSPESFTGTEMEYARDICNAVIDIWQPTASKKVIINLPVTVSMSSSNVYASQVEYMCKVLNHRENLIICLHPHNDRGCAIADTELGLLAGGDRVEGTLFGNGERTGNVDIVTLALNMYSHGVDPGLNFENIPNIVEKFEEFTNMTVYDRQPYAGKLVFAAFSGSHQDAIAKGMKFVVDKAPEHWCVPYLAIDPHDIGRQYDGDVIRINSQSGKGGIGYLLETKFGFCLPPKMRESFGYAVKNVSDHEHKELQPQDVLEIFNKNYVNISAPIKIISQHFEQKEEFSADIKGTFNKKEFAITASGNGRLDAATNVIIQLVGKNFNITEYSEHALTNSSKSEAVAYLCVSCEDKKEWGVGIHSDIIAASVYALVSAVNKIFAKN